jgi:DmsE family decaheme c-type cytochrome
MCLLSGVSFAAPEKAGKRQTTDIVMKGDARCTRCHNDVNDGEVENYPVLPIGKTKHGTQADERTPTCVSCHGDSERHLKQEGKIRPLPDRPFGKKLAADPKSHNNACLSCHETGKLTHWMGSIHARRDVACTSCHQMHTGQDKATHRPQVAEMCMNCHKEKRAQITRPSRHPILEGKVVCTDCHNPHGSAGPKLMVKDSVNETCYPCHMEYRGPFLWNHMPVREDCSLCHNPHGTVTSNLLKQRAPFLCQQCHEPNSHRGNFPGINTTAANTAGAGALTLGRGCLNCHTNIHGGNNATNANSSRTMRR